MKALAAAVGLAIYAAFTILVLSLCRAAAEGDSQR